MFATRVKALVIASFAVVAWAVAIAITRGIMAVFHLA